MTWTDPTTGLELPAPAPGVPVFSATRRHADDGGTFPIGGLIVDTHQTTDPETGEIVDMVTVAEHWHGQIRYHTLQVDDIDRTQYHGQVRPDLCRAMAQQMSLDQARGRHTDHLQALLALSVAVERRGERRVS